MSRKGLFAAMAMCGALLGGAPALATQNFGAVGNVINQLHNGASLSGNGFVFTINNGGQQQVLFTGLAGVQQFNNNLGGFNSWVNGGNPVTPGGYAYTPTFTGVGAYFGGGGGGGGYNYMPTFTAVGSYFNTGGGGNVQPTGFQAPVPVQTGPIPEPGTWAMMIFGFFAVGLALRRRRGTSNFA